MAIVRLLPVVTFLLLALTARAQIEVPPPDDPGFEHQKLAFEAIDRGDYRTAESELRKQIELQQWNFVPWFNLSCVQCRVSKLGEAMDSLERAVELGFVNRHLLETEPDLEPLRDSPRFYELLHRWKKTVDEVYERHFEHVKKTYGPAYHYERDATRRIQFASFRDDEMFELARTEIDAVTAWGVEHVFYNLRGFEASDDPWVTVILPNRKDFLRWAVKTFGPGAITDMRQVGGSYTHDTRELVTMDLGSSLRHEFFHALHWRSNTRSGSIHPIWVQEGLCALVEDFDVMPDGSLEMRLSWRTNVAGRMARNGRLLTIKELSQFTHAKFSGNNPLSNYAQARTFFVFLYSTGRLGEWYRALDDNFTEDRSGIKATELVFGKPIEEVEKIYLDWVRALPEVSTPERPPGARLGIDTDTGDGTGLKVEQVVSGGARALRPGDVIFKIDNRPVRELNELFRVMGDYNPGETVKVRYRRGDDFRDADVLLVK